MNQELIYHFDFVKKESDPRSLIRLAATDSVLSIALLPNKHTDLWFLCYPVLTFFNLDSECFETSFSIDVYRSDRLSYAVGEVAEKLETWLNQKGVTIENNPRTKAKLLKVAEMTEPKDLQLIETIGLVLSVESIQNYWIQHLADSN